MRNKITAAVVIGLAVTLSGAALPQKAMSDEVSIVRTVTEGSTIIEPSYVMDSSPVLIENVIDRPSIERVIERPVMTERYVESPVFVKTETRPVVIDTLPSTNRHLLNLGLFDLLRLKLF